MAELRRQYYLTGELYSEVFIINGKKEGQFRSYYPNGTLCIICNYVNGKINGEYKQYHQNGQLNVISNYNDDLDLKFNRKIYYDNGQLVYNF